MKITHGHWSGGRASKLYSAHQSMLMRCYNESVDSFGIYHKKGIVVCDRWRCGENGLSGFECFALDVGNPPTPAHSLDRIKNGGNYEPGNVRWATSKEQANNRSTNRLLTAFGRTQTIAQWMIETGLTESMIRHRVFKMKMDTEGALSAPKMKPGRKPKPCCI